jgi:hypothetical protein
MDIMNDLGLHFGEAALLAAGLLKQRSRGSSPILSFLHYYALKAAFLVIPHIKDGRPVYLKARPPISKDEAERRGLVRFLSTGGTITRLSVILIIIPSLFGYEYFICRAPFLVGPHPPSCRQGWRSPVGPASTASLSTIEIQIVEMTSILPPLWP